MNNDVYELPIFLSYEEINWQLKCFLDEIKDDPMTGFRNLYSSSKAAFFNTINEMILRGFKFKIDSNLFPKINFDNSDYLECSNGEGYQFRRIDFDALGIGQVISDFEINNDLFFHKVPIDGFCYFNPSLDKKYLVDLFLEAGYKVICSDKSSSFVRKINLDNNTDNSKSSTKISEYFNEPKYNLFRKFCNRKHYRTLDDLSVYIICSFEQEKHFGEKKIRDILEKYENYLTANNKNEEKSSLKISDYFYESRYNLFRDFCERNNYGSLDDLSWDIIYSLEHEKYFGEKKIKDILNKYNNYLKSANKYKKERFKGKEFSKYQFRIESIFANEKFRNFLNFCERKHIKLVSDLSEDILEEYENQKGVGDRRMNMIKGKLLDLKRSYIVNDSDTFHIEYYEELVNFDISVNEYFQLFNINYEVIADLYLSDLQDKKYADIAEYCPIDILILLEKSLNRYSDVETILNQAIEEAIDNKELYRAIVEKRIEWGETLESVAQGFDITRERIRQLSNKIIETISRILESECFFSYLRLLFWDKEILFKDDFESAFPRHYKTLAKLIEEGKTKLYWNEKFGFYSFSEIDLIDPPILNDQNEYYFTNDLVNECLSYWGGIIDDLNEKTILNILCDTYGFTVYGEFLFKHKIRKNKCVEVLLRYYFNDGIKLDEKGCEAIRKMANNKLNFDMSLDSDRALESMARNNEKLILCAPLTFRYYNESKDHAELIEKVDAFIDDYFIHNSLIHSDLLFNHFRNICIELDILNDTELYSLVKMYRQDKYTFSKGNEMCIYKSEGERISRDAQLLNLFSSKQRIMLTKQEILEKLHWPAFKLENTIAESRTSFACGSSSKVYCLSYIELDSQEIQILRNHYQMCQENDYCFLNKLYYDLKFDPVFNKTLKKYQIDNGTDLGILMKYISGVRTWFNIAFSIESKKKNVYDVLLSRFPDLTSRENVVNYLRDNNYENKRISNIVTVLEEKKLFVSIDRDDYVNKNTFSVDGSDVAALLEYIGDDEYVLLNTLRGYRSQLPKINYKWTPILMAEILSNNGYRVVLKKNRDYRYDYSIVVKDNSIIRTISDLIYKILKEEYKGSYDISSIVKYMNERKVFPNKVLPYEVSKDPRFEIDEFDILHLR